MKKKYVVILILTISIIFSCKKSSEKDVETETTEVENFYNDEESQEAYPDGTYCAEVEYYNPNTGTRNTYTLNVEVENNELTIIHWPNGGWLDEDHFYPEELDSTGFCSFTSDKNYEYEIQITGSECSFTDDSRIRKDINYDEQESTCPKCGDKKEKYDDLCWSCERKQKDKEEHTCKRCGEYDSFMFSTDDYCSDCERELEEEENNNNN